MGRVCSFNRLKRRLHTTLALNGMPDRSAKRTSPDGEAAALEQPLCLRGADHGGGGRCDQRRRRRVQPEPAEVARLDACGYLHSRECRSDAATTVIFIMIVVLLVEHYVHDSGLR